MTCQCGKPLTDKRPTRCYQCYKAAILPRIGVLSREDILSHAGLLQTDAAALLGISYVQFRRTVKRLGIRDMFPRHGGEASQLAQRGYAAKDNP